MDYDAIVIGTGIGGSVAAAVLAGEGLRVLVVEKNSRVGGICAAYDKQGFHVDIGTHLFSRGKHGPLGRLTRRLGLPAIPFVQPRDLALVCGFGGRLVLPRDRRRLPVFLLSAIRELKLSPREVVQATRFFREILLFDEARLPELDRMTMWEFVTRYTENPRLVGLLGFILGLYFILPLSLVSAGEGVWCFKHMAWDYGLSYPLGGAVTVPRRFLECAEAHGAEVLTDKRVERIIVEGRAVRGVECADGSDYAAPVVIGTTSLKDHVEHLVGAEHFPPSYAERVRGLKSSMVAVQAKFALRKPLVKAGCVVGVMAQDFDVNGLELGDLERMYQHVQDGEIAPITPIYAPVPSNFDPSLAPPGRQLITACAVAPTTDIALKDDSQAWTKNLELAMQSLVPGLEAELLWVDTLSTEAVGRWIGKLNAPAVSTGQTPDQVGNRRPPVHTPILGLYVAGCAAGARGVGTELAAASGEEAADRVVQDVSNGLIPRAGTRLVLALRKGALPRDAAAE